ncbi:MAG: helix-turn-helix domain-containing protein, partial [Bacteroidota bacterium]
EQARYGSRKIAEEEATGLLQALDKLMTEEALYLNPELSQQEVAKKLGIIPHRLSQLLNENLGQSFPNYLNTRRVAEAKRLIKKQKAYSLESIGYDAGFRSKSTFYAAFKKHAGTTPATFRKKLEEAGPQQ